MIQTLPGPTSSSFSKSTLRSTICSIPSTEQGDGPTYLVNQEKIIGCIYYYVLHTGDVSFLEEQINGKSILDWVFHYATFGDDLSKPAVLVDYGEGR